MPRRPAKLPTKHAAAAERESLLAWIAEHEPSLAKQAKTYSLAVLRWTKAGRPTRSAEEIESILDICRGCDYYTETDRSRCRKCGCSVNNSPDGLKNKIAMGTERCPLNPPKWPEQTADLGDAT